MSESSPARYSTTNRSGSSASLCKRGSLPLWSDEEMTWFAPHDGRPGRLAIHFYLTIKLLFMLPLRQTTVMVASLLKLGNLDWTVPDYTTLWCRQKTLVVQIPYRPADGPFNLLVDSTGIKFPAMASGRRASTAFRADTSGARGIWPWIPPLRTSGRWSSPPAATATSSRQAPPVRANRRGVLPELPDQIPEGEEIDTVTADGACDTRRCHTAITLRQAMPIIPIRKSGRPWKEDCPAALARN